MPDGGIEVTFIKPDGTMKIRMMHNTINDICKAAEALKASHFIMVEEVYRRGASVELGQGVVWGVFEMRTADRNNPTPGEWSIRDPIRTFPLDALDAAVMWTITTQCRR